jgi:hypothetical protein
MPIIRPILLLAALLLAMPAEAQTACPAGQKPMLTVRLYFGMLQNGKLIPDSAWEDFLGRSVTPRLPGDYTVIGAMGRWRNPLTQVTGREPAHIIEVDAPDTRDLRDKADAIRKDYAARFRQQSVGIVTLPACGAF